MNLASQNSYAFRIFVTLSLLLCAIFGGKAYESACAAAWRLRNDDKFYRWAWANITIWLMDFVEPGHCYKSWLWYQKIRVGLSVKVYGEEE